MNRLLYSLCLLQTFPAATAVTAASATEDPEELALGTVPTTEQIMDPRIHISEIPESEVASSYDAGWDRNTAVRDVAYFLRAHKFEDYDRRYFTSLGAATSRLYEEFPRPALRSLHWEVRRHCEPGFPECLRYLEGIVRVTGTRRRDDTSTIVKERKWSLANESEKIVAVRRECQTARRRDDLTLEPFQGPIERFQWRTSASYYMCWYTMLGAADLAIFGEACDNHANCLLDYGLGNLDPRADDDRPFACALYSFCPDHCCPVRHVWYFNDCYRSPTCPCYADNPPAHRRCTLNRSENRDFSSLLANSVNVSCECPSSGYVWSSRFGLCVDIDECSLGQHDCTEAKDEACLNLPGTFACVCRLGHVYAEGKGCVRSTEIERSLVVERVENGTRMKSVLGMIADTIARSRGRGLGVQWCFVPLAFALRWVVNV